MTEVVHRSGVVPQISARVDSHTGRPRSLSVLGFLVALLLNGLEKNHTAQICAIASTLNALTPRQRERLGIRNWDPEQAYQRTDRLFNKIARALEQPHEATVDGRVVTIDSNWFANRVVRAASEHDLAGSSMIALDGTALRTPARLQPGNETMTFDGDADAEEAARQVSGKAAEAPRKAAVLGVGSDGRRQYTADPDARGGYRTATDRQPGQRYIGYELHLATLIPRIRSTNGIDRISFGEKVPNVAGVMSVVPAGSHRGDAVRPHLLEAVADGFRITDVIMDPGYSMLRPETLLQPLRKAGISSHFKPVTHQLGRKPLNDDYILINGQPFSRHTPSELGGEGGDELPVVYGGAPAEQQQRSRQEHDRRARYRAVRHTRPDADGYVRIKCPYCGGLLYSRQLGRPPTRKSAAQATLREHSTTCCGGTTTLTADDIALDQPLAVGGTAWHKNLNRRNLVETANSMLKGGFTDIEARGYLRVVGLAKHALLLAGTLVGYNDYVLRTFKRDREAAARQEAPRRRRRSQESTRAARGGKLARATSSGTDPPR